MSKFQPMKTSSLIACRVTFETLLVEVYEVPVHFLLKLHSNLCGRNVNLSDYVWLMILVQFEVPSQILFILQVANMVNVVLCSHKLLAVFPLGCFILNSQIISTPWHLFIFLFLFISLSIEIIYYTDIGIILASRYPSIWLTVLG